MSPLLALAPDPWADEETKPENGRGLEARRAEERLQADLRERAFELMGERGIKTFAEAMEMVRGEGRPAW